MVLVCRSSRLQLRAWTCCRHQGEHHPSSLGLHCFPARGKFHRSLQLLDLLQIWKRYRYQQLVKVDCWSYASRAPSR